MMTNDDLRGIIYEGEIEVLPSLKSSLHYFFLPRNGRKRMMNIVKLEN